jgi:hypothetical protein
LVWIEIIDYLFVGKEHPATAIAVHAEVIEDLFGILACLFAALILIICRGDDFPTGETSYGYHAGMISKLISISQR